MDGVPWGGSSQGTTTEGVERLRSLIEDLGDSFSRLQAAPGARKAHQRKLPTVTLELPLNIDNNGLPQSDEGTWRIKTVQLAPPRKKITDIVNEELRGRHQQPLSQILDDSTTAKDERAELNRNQRRKADPCPPMECDHTRKKFHGVREFVTLEIPEPGF